MFHFIVYAEKYYRQSAAILWLIIFSVLIMVFIIIKVPNSYAYNLPSTEEKFKVMSSLLA